MFDKAMFMVSSSWAKSTISFSRTAEPPKSAGFSLLGKGRRHFFGRRQKNAAAFSADAVLSAEMAGNPAPFL
jgi:hypothetical protein